MQSLIFFLIAIVILVVIHEFGHFWVARRCGVKVLRFSVGFGPVLWQRQAQDGTIYSLAAIPLGGFVKMLDEREDEVADNELDKAFNRKPLLSRIAIVAAGPLANLLFAALAYWALFIIGIDGMRPIIGQVVPASIAAEAHIVVGDEIKTINGQVTPTWQAVNKVLFRLKSEEAEAITVVVLSSQGEQTYVLKLPEIEKAGQVKRPLLTELGLSPIQIKLAPVIGFITKKGRAEQAGIKVGDKLVALGEREIDDWHDWVAVIEQSPNQVLNLTIERDGLRLDKQVTPDKTEEGKGHLGVGVDVSATEIPQELKATLRYGPLIAAEYAISETTYITTMIIKSVGGMLTGAVSSENIGGPISIAHYAGASAERGLSAFIAFLAMISISLGILNLLPIPILDGGHLMMYIIEGLSGKPVSEQVQLYAQKVGMTLLLMLMFLAFFNDLARLFG